MIAVMTSIFTFINILAPFIFIFINSQIKLITPHYNIQIVILYFSCDVAIYTFALKGTFGVDTVRIRIWTSITLVTFVQINTIKSIPLSETGLRTPIKLIELKFVKSHIHLDIQQNKYMYNCQVGFHMSPWGRMGNFHWSQNRRIH